MIIGRIAFKIRHFLRLLFLKRKIGKLGRGCTVAKYYCIEGKGVSIDEAVEIAEGAWIKASDAINKENVELRIEKGCRIGRFNEIYATKCIILERKVLTAERVYISDNTHGYYDPYIPIMDQPLVQSNPVRIGEGSWLGAGVAILGANVGKHCVIGTNAVVTYDIPDYSIAVGIPARVIKRYDFNKKEWIKV